MRKLVNAIISGAIMLAGAAVFAQETQDPMMQDQQGQDQMMQEQQGQPAQGAQQSPDQYLDKEVMLQGGEPAGTVDDVYVDPQSDQPLFLVVKTDQQEYKIIPAEKVSMQQDQVQAQIEMQQFEQAPSMSQQEYDQMQTVTSDLVTQSFQQYQVDEGNAMQAESLQSGQTPQQGGQQGGAAQGAQQQDQQMQEPMTEDQQQTEEQPLF